MKLIDFFYVPVAAGFLFFFVRLDKKPSASFREPILWTLAAVLLAALSFTPIMNPPQCDSHAQANAFLSNCIIGANIGAGLYLLTVVPMFLLFALVFWVRAFKARAGLTKNN